MTMDILRTRIHPLSQEARSGLRETTRRTLFWRSRTCVRTIHQGTGIRLVVHSIPQGNAAASELSATAYLARPCGTTIRSGAQTGLLFASTSFDNREGGGDPDGESASPPRQADGDMARCAVTLPILLEEGGRCASLKIPETVP